MPVPVRPSPVADIGHGQIGGEGQRADLLLADPGGDEPGEVAGRRHLAPKEDVGLRRGGDPAGQPVAALARVQRRPCASASGGARLCRTMPVP